jgi:hypothetical protein
MVFLMNHALRFTLRTLEGKPYQTKKLLTARKVCCTLTILLANVDKRTQVIHEQLPKQIDIEDLAPVLNAIPRSPFVGDSRVVH